MEYPRGMTMKHRKEKGESLMADDIKRTDLDEEELKKVAATAEAKQMRHRLDEYVAMVIAIGAVLILWLLQSLGLY